MGNCQIWGILLAEVTHNTGGEIQYCKSPQIFKDQPDGQVTFLYTLHVKLQR